MRRVREHARAGEFRLKDGRGGSPAHQPVDPALAAAKRLADTLLPESP